MAGRIVSLGIRRFASRTDRATIASFNRVLNDSFQSCSLERIIPVKVTAFDSVDRCTYHLGIPGTAGTVALLFNTCTYLNRFEFCIPSYTGYITSEVRVRERLSNLSTYPRYSCLHICRGTSNLTSVLETSPRQVEPTPLGRGNFDSKPAGKCKQIYANIWAR